MKYKTVSTQRHNVDHLTPMEMEGIPWEAARIVLGRNEQPDEPLHGVRIKQPCGRPKKLLPTDHGKAMERLQVVPERCYCLACDTTRNDAT